MTTATMHWPADAADLIRRQGFVHGRWTDADDGETLPVQDPASLEVIATVPAMGAAETRRAVDAAHAALPAWRAATPAVRAGMLEAWHAAVLSNIEALAYILTREQGKPIAEARTEIAYAAGFLSWYAGEARRIYGDVVTAGAAVSHILVLKRPVGVVAAITPWNFPAAMITRKVGAALAAGCTVVLKPSELTPLTALALARLAQTAGLPAGVLNVVTGPPVGIGKVLTGDARVRKLTFTGSTAVGRKLAEQCAPTLKRVSLELGGNAPFIVFDDANMDAAVEGLVQSKYRNGGQTCVCANRILVQAGVHDAFVERFAARAATLRVGSGMADGVEIGPLINAEALVKVERHLQDALAKGATLVTGGRALNDRGAGAFFEPTVLSNAQPTMILAQEETFGPLAPIFRFDDEAEAIALANATATGLSAYVYTASLSRMLRLAESIETGMIGVNTGRISSELMPFGGVKESGFGREGSKYGLDDYIELKSIALGVEL